MTAANMEFIAVAGAAEAGRAAAEVLLWALAPSYAVLVAVIVRRLRRERGTSRDRRG